MSNVLVLGNMGMAGFVISTFLKDKGHIVTGYARRKSPSVETIIGDAKDTGKLREIIEKNTFDYIINCIGVLNQFAENDKENSIFINSYLPHYLKKVTEDLPTKIIHMSTDCVFSGKKGGYAENDFTDGETFYDRTKALGELIDEKNITLRNSIIGPDINPDGIGLFNWFMKQNGNINGFTHAIWNGLTTVELAKIIDYIITHRSNHSGLTNMVNNEAIDKYSLLLLFKNIFDRNSLIITPSDKVVLDKSLVRTNFDLDYTVPSYQRMIEEMKIWIDSHRKYFAHYF